MTELACMASWLMAGVAVYAINKAFKHGIEINLKTNTKKPKKASK